MALIVLLVVEQRLDAVRAVLAGASVTEVAARTGVSRQSVHTWLARYLAGGVTGLVDRSHRPDTCPHQAPAEVEVRVAELRREHPRWGAKRIRMELLRRSPPWKAEEVLAAELVPSEATINRILRRRGLVKPRPRARPRESFIRFERPGPMQLWGIDIVGGIDLVDLATGVIREAKIVTGVDDHSRFCVLARVVERATSRAVCLGFAQALARFGVPEEVITDNGKQFTDRFSRYAPTRGEVLFDKICRHNGITHRLTTPASPNQNGKVERFHGTLRPEIEAQNPFASLAAAQAAVDAWVLDYNTNRPHQGLDDRVPVMPAERFVPAAAGGIALWLPPALAATSVSDGADAVVPEAEPLARPHPVPEDGPADLAPVTTTESSSAVALDRVVPGSGNLAICGNQFWLGPARAGQVVRFWIDCDWVHLSVGEQRVKSLRSRFTVTDLTRLQAQGAVPAGPPPLASRAGPGARANRTIVEVERTVARNGMVSLGNQVVLAAEILAGRRVGIYIEEGAPLLFFDPQTRELLRVRPNPLPPGDAARLQRCRPVGTIPRPSTEPITVQRRASATGVMVVAGQKIAVGREHAGHTLTVHVSDTIVAIDLPGGDTMTVRRTNHNPVVASKDSGRGPLTPQFPSQSVKDHVTRIRQGSTASRQAGDETAGGTKPESAWIESECVCSST